MKILLLNDNPVVNKLVTLSAHKTSDELEIVESIDAIELDSYDLLVIDDTLYSQETMEALQEKITYSKSLYICSRDSEPVDSFTSTLKKPFLPTDLVELFSVLGKEANSVDLSEEDPEEFSLDLDDVVVEEDESDDEDILDLGSLEDLDIEDELILDEEDDDSEDDIVLDDELSFEEELSLDEDDITLDEDIQENILDKDEVQEVQDLLEETNSDDLSLEEELEEVLEQESEELSVDETLLEAEELEEKIEITDDFEEDLEDEILELEEEPEEEVEIEEELEKEIAELEDDFEEELEDEILELPEEAEEEVENTDDFEEELEELEDDFEEELDNELDLESQIENAVEELSEEELDSEIDVDTLMDITANDLSDIDSLTSKDLKLAIGEDVEEDEIIEEDVSDAVNPNEQVDGVEALKNLLTALSDKNVAASMKGMKISINITLGDN